MTNTKSTKRALLMSVISLLLCFTMLVGTTFAWFTDSVTSANNIITSGNLDIELYYQLEGETSWTKVTETTNVFKEDTLWEPGHTEVVKLKIVNEGSLALKYNLGVNVASETGSVNMAGEDFLLSEFIKFAVIDGENTYARDEAIAAAEAAGATALKTAYNSGTTQLLATEEDYVTMVVYMPTTVGNEANPAKGAATPTINLGLNLFATQTAYEEDSFNDQYDADAITIVTTAAEAQAALDNATAGTIIKLAPGNYGTLVVRPVEGQAHTESGDWYTYRTELARTIENVTILGAVGAKVDGITFDVGYKGGSDDTFHYVNIKNLVIDGVEFTNNTPSTNMSETAPIFVNVQNTNIDGLTVKNCKLIGAGANTELIYLYDEAANHTFETASKNVTISGNTVDGVKRLCNLYGTENVTITGNTVKNTVEHGVLLSGGPYSGNVVISNNTFDSVGSIGDVNVVRMAGADNANVTISNNTATNYLGGRDAFAKVDGGTPVIENNTFASIGVKDAAAAQKALDNAVAGTTIQLQSGVNYGTLVVRPVLGAAHTQSGDWHAYRTELARTIENVTILGADGAKVDGIKFDTGYKGGTDDTFHYVNIKNLVIDGVEFTSTGVATGMGNTASIFVNLQHTNLDGLTVKNCKVSGAANNNFVHIYDDANNSTFATASKNVTLTNNTVDGVAVFAELRGTENVTITDNSIKNTSSVGIILGVYSGEGYSNVTITGNTFDNCAEGALDYVTNAMPSTFSEADVIANNTGLTDSNVTGW